jgi:enamine deaminase RidA (YjgF/YER057c/UK114 family)
MHENQTVRIVTIAPARTSNMAMPSSAANNEAASSTQGERASGSQISLTFKPLPGESVPDLCRRLARQLDSRAATPLHLLVYGNVRAGAATIEALEKSSGHADWPLTWVEGADCDGGPIAGIQVHAFTGSVERIEFGGRVVGSVFTEGGARQCLVGGLVPADRTLSRPDQTRRALEDLQAILAQAGFALADAVRTWFFLDDILSWYGDFNRVRTQIYSGMKFRTNSLPASTGVGAKNPAGAALEVGAWAMQPLNSSARAEEIASLLQCPAPAYGSSFSRAMELTSATGRRLLISGTASIAPGGETLWLGDARRQVAQTMEVVEAILRSRGFGFSDLSRATAYFKRRSDAQAFVEWQEAHGLQLQPAVLARCDICRDDLLFELEADAWCEQTHAS